VRKYLDEFQEAMKYLHRQSKHDPLKLNIRILPKRELDPGMTWSSLLEGGDFKTIESSRPRKE
jgi:hypothetical protein